MRALASLLPVPVLCVIGLSVGAPLAAQDAEPAAAPELESPAALPASARSPVFAGTLELLVPTAGYAYAGDWAKGLPPAAVRIGGGLLLLASIPWLDDRETFRCAQACLAGVTLTYAGAIWGVVGAVRAARAHNRRHTPAP